MAYRLWSDETIQAGVRRVARWQIERALVELGDRALGPHAGAFAVRKRCKKIRSLIGLVRPVFDGYEAENAAFREIGRCLAGLRDAASLLEAFDSLVPPGSENAHRLAGVRLALLAGCVQGRLEDAGASLGSARQCLVSARERIETWSVAAEGFGAIGAGLRRGYARGRRAMRRAEREPTLERLHEWRKWLKHDRAHTRLLADLWGPEWPGRLGDAKALSDLLGLEHDLGLLSAALAAGAVAAEGEPEGIGALGVLIAARRGALRAEAFAVGRRLYSVKPGEHMERARQGWERWRG